MDFDTLTKLHMYFSTAVDLQQISFFSHLNFFLVYCFPSGLVPFLVGPLDSFFYFNFCVYQLFLLLYAQLSILCFQIDVSGVIGIFFFSFYFLVLQFLNILYIINVIAFDFDFIWLVSLIFLDFDSSDLFIVYSSSLLFKFFLFDTKFCIII